MTLPERQERPAGNQAPSKSIATDLHIVTPTTVTIVDLQAWAETSRGRFMVETTVGDGTHRRTYYYANVRAAQRCVERARARGAEARVALIQTIPVGIVTGLGGGR